MNQLPANPVGVHGTGAARFYRGPSEAVFDLNLLRQACAQVLERVAPMVADRAGDPVTCVSLTHRREAADRLGDGLVSQFAPDGTMRYLEREFCCFNDDFADTYFAVVWRSLTALMPVGRMRLMVVRPQQVYRMHADATKRAHLAIHTDPDAFLVGPDGQGYHVPADGRLRVFDTRLRHTVFHAGTTDRVHLLMAVADTERRHHTAVLQRPEVIG
ncbi:aspartyl/asparaginyl beta-hydroxylase domain-containing protein [Nocardia wallacei]|uniref:aspartyl/asparaginyl beta-hydroxylase domain-containing protein n=1 Tax=Nocardia wallacei TaxID=480035 RepID=UPI002454CD16|nr:aspartyl/asparaginyl beta-hydroxylase domain-containing protein [Nocardia wallacei]